MRALEARQDEIMRKLFELKAAVDGLAKTVATPDADLDLTVSCSLASPSPTACTFTGTADLDTLLGKVGRGCGLLLLHCLYIFSDWPDQYAHCKIIFSIILLDTIFIGHT